MRLRELFAAEDAVSPVIGVVLMTAIAVVLAAAVGTFVLNLGGDVRDTAPQASFEFEYANGSAASDGSADGDELRITHVAGDGVPGDELSVSVTGASKGDGTAATHTGDHFSGGSVTAGATTTLNDADFDGTSLGATHAANDVGLASATVRVVWTAEDGGRSTTLGTWTGPEA